MIKHSQSIQSNKFAISLQYLKKEIRGGVYFLHADKHQKFLQVGISPSGENDQTCLKYLK